ncbi:IQ domain-containing protein N isoform X2 [Mustela putorius furo]|uniref:IQ domain-containing protein N n=1 Tax=Mustela putorius furo TaxID=9669 RepID=A0A8U0MY40_MUSPF|nr:IQ domain-containing protein N isoform X2 [Mustela putorius furo]
MALQELTRPETKTMQEAAQLPSSTDGQNVYQPQSVSSLQDKAGTLSPQLQHEPVESRETLLQQHDKDVTVPRHIPRLRAVVESQAFKNVLVDEMDMMLSRAATLIQANWRGYRLRQKLISQMKAAKAIQEAWRRFNTRRLLHSGKTVEKKVSVDEGDIPYHAPQQVRFQPPGEVKPPVAQPVMVSKETQFPSSDNLDTCTHQLALLQAQGGPQPGMQAPGSTGGPSVTFLPHQTIAIRLPCPVNLDAKCHPCLMTRTVRNACLVHVEGDMVKTKQVTTRANKAGAPGPPPCGRYAQAVHGSLKNQTQGHVETEVLKVPPQTGPALVINKTAPQMYPVTTMTKTPPQPCAAPMVTIAKTPPQVYPAARMTKTPTQMNPAAAMTKTPPHPYPAVAMPKSPLQSCLAAMMSKTLPPPCSVPTVTITKAPPQTYPVAPMAKSPPQTCPVAPIAKASPQTSQPATMIKTPLQSGLGGMANKTPTQPCPVAPMSKTPTQMRPTASMTNASPQTRPAAMMAKISPQICLLASMIKPQTQTRPMATMGKAPPQTCPVPTMAKTPAQMRPAAPMTKTPLQTCPATAMAKTPSQMLPGTSVTKTPPQTRLAAMVTKTPAQFRSMAAILKTLCLPPSAAGNLKSSPPATVASGIPNASSRTCLNGPKAKAMVNAKQTAGMVRVSSHSYLAEGKVKYFNAPHLGAGTPKAPARPPLEAERMKAFSQKQVKMETVSSSNVAIEMSQASPWVKTAEDRNKSLLQTCPRADVVKVQSQVYVPMETAVVLPRAQLAPCPTKVPPQTHLETCLAKGLPQEQLATCRTTASSQGQLLAELTAALPQAHPGTCLSKTLSQAHPSTKLTPTQAQAHPGTCLSKALSQAHSPAKLTKTPSFAHLGTCLTKVQSRAHLASRVIKVQSKAHLSTELTKAQSQAQLVTETAKCLYTAQHSAELSGKTQSQPLLAGFKVSTQPCKHTGALGNLPRAKPEDRLTQIQPHSYVQGKGTQGPSQGPCETKSMLVPLAASAGHPTCNVESWGDSGATRAQSPMPGPATPCPEELAASQLASLCAELAAELGSQEDLRTLLTKALSQGQVRAALNQALSKKALGSTMAKALPQGKLGTALMKVLSWGELGLALSRTLSPGELRAELTKAKQGKLADVLSKALTEEEWAALSQALCQGELGAVLSQSLSQAALRTGVVLPKAASKTAGSRMSVIPAPVEVDCRGNPAAAWGSAVGPVRPQPSKGPVDAGIAGGQAWNSAAVPSGAAGPTTSTVAPDSAWDLARASEPWDTVGREAAVDSKQSGEQVASLQAVEKVVTRAVVTIQACARGYLVRRTIRVWHQWAVIIQAAWRGYRVRRDLARLSQAATTIQATWRGFRARQIETQQQLVPGVWTKADDRTKSTSDHRCFQSCQPRVCPFCQSLSPSLGSPPSVVMLVGSSPRTCHMCGHTLPTRVVHGMGRGSRVQASMPGGCDSPMASQSSQQSHLQNKAATTIQSAWRGFAERRQLRQQQMAAKMLQANWRGHHTRVGLTPDALLGAAAWDNPEDMQWPGV